MCAPESLSRPGFIAGALAASFAVTAASTPPANAQSAPPAAAAALVDCRLPPQIRSLGRNVTYLAAGRQIQLSATECRQRGGSWNGRGPGARAGAQAPLAVTVGGDAKEPACPLRATVSGLHGGSLAVRNGPGTKFERVDRLDEGARVFLCDRAGEAGWVGIVYGSGDCGLAAPIDPPRAYAGACRTGWVRSNYLR